MSFRLEYTLNAQTEIEDSYLWIKDRAPMAAEKWRDELIGKIDGLAEDRSGIHSPLKVVSSLMKSV